MNYPVHTAGWKFIRVIGTIRPYRSMVYLLVAFPLGVFYFVFLISGLSIGISLSIVWVGIPILVLVGAGCWLLAMFERLMARIWLEEDIPRMEDESTKPANLWMRFIHHLTNPVTWKSLVYLFIKFPLGMVSFVIVITLGALTLALLSSPFLFGTHQFFQDGGFFGLALLDFQVDSMKEAILAALAGLILLPLTLHIFNGLAWLHGKFARLMLSVCPDRLIP